jgi:putative acetyltransferase
MEHIHRAARKRHIVELSSDVSLTAEPFFVAHGFVVEARQSVVVRGIASLDARMRKRLAAPSF